MFESSSWSVAGSMLCLTVIAAFDAACCCGHALCLSLSLSLTHTHTLTHIHTHARTFFQSTWQSYDHAYSRTAFGSRFGASAPPIPPLPPQPNALALKSAVIAIIPDGPPRWALRQHSSNNPSPTDLAVLLHDQAEAEAAAASGASGTVTVRTDRSRMCEPYRRLVPAHASVACGAAELVSLSYAGAVRPGRATCHLDP